MGAFAMLGLALVVEIALIIHFHNLGLAQSSGLSGLNYLFFAVLLIPVVVTTSIFFIAAFFCMFEPHTQEPKAEYVPLFDESYKGLF